METSDNRSSPLTIGQHHSLVVLRLRTPGAFLGNDSGQEVLLPNKYVPQDIEVGQSIRVFVYLDSNDRAVATTLTPDVLLNQFGTLRCKMVGKPGAFLDWGLEKDLFVPFREQAERMEEGKSYVVYVYIDDSTFRLMASSKVKQFLDNRELTVEEGEEVNLLIFERTELGYNAIVNQMHLGLLYHNEVFTDLKPGDSAQGFVKKIREHNKLDIALQRQGYQNIAVGADRIMAALHAHEGFLPINDKSPPEAIRHYLSMSKRTFKTAVGNLYKKRLIRFENDGIRLLGKSR